MDSEASAGVIPGGHGKAVPLCKGQRVKLTNTFGSQVVDTWALNARDTSEYLSVEHTRRVNGHLFPEVGDALLSNRRTAMLRLLEDSSPGRHDTLVACCDKWLYKHYGCPPGHRNCRDNFGEALFAAGYDAPLVPNPINLWMNIPVRGDREISVATPLSKPGDYLVLEALMDCVLVFSACPMDITPINGEDRTPRSVEFSVLQRA